MKPIEPGCLAVILGSPHDAANGVVVRVIKFVGRVSEFSGDDNWECSNEPLLDGSRVDCPVCRQIYLYRIDGFEETEEVEEADHA